MDDHFVRDEAGLAERRHAGKAGLARERPSRQSVAGNAANTWAAKTRATKAGAAKSRMTKSRRTVPETICQTVFWSRRMVGLASTLAGERRMGLAKGSWRRRGPCYRPCGRRRASGALRRRRIARATKAKRHDRAGKE
jgi:hypothetical protein